MLKKRLIVWYLRNRLSKLETLCFDSQSVDDLFGCHDTGVQDSLSLLHSSRMHFGIEIEISQQITQTEWQNQHYAEKDG